MKTNDDPALVAFLAKREEPRVLGNAPLTFAVGDRVRVRRGEHVGRRGAVYALAGQDGADVLLDGRFRGRTFLLDDLDIIAPDAPGRHKRTRADS